MKADAQLNFIDQQAERLAANAEYADRFDDRTDTFAAHGRVRAVAVRRPVEWSFTLARHGTGYAVAASCNAIVG
jgi:hypothetical protein